MRTIAILTLFGITLSSLIGCSGAKNAANNAAHTAGNAAGAAGNAAGSAAGAMGNAAQGAAGAMGNAAEGAAADLTKPNCGAVQPVWVNLKTRVYHEPDDPMYGRTKHGKFLCPSVAKSQGFRPAGGAMRHHAGSSSSM